MRLYTDKAHKLAYSVDASLFEIEPAAVALPRSIDELRAVIESSDQTITARGAGTGTAGGCLGDGLILDCSHLNQIIEIDHERKVARCEPGVVQDDLNKAASAFGLRLGPDTSTGDRATIGGMIATNAAGAHSLIYGAMVDAIERVELLTAEGREITLPGDPQITRAAEQIKTIYGEAIRRHFPPLARRSSGYLLDRLFGDKLAQIVAGSEGTLGIITSVELKLSPQLPDRRLYYLRFDSTKEAIAHVGELLALRPLSLELIDEQICSLGRLSPSLRGQLDWLVPGALLLIELPADQPPVGTLIERPEQAWALRHAGLGLLLSRRTHARAVGFIEDLAVPTERLGDLIDLLPDRDVGIYGHAGAGCLHVRPFLDLREGHEKMWKMMREITESVVEMGGAASGEHGDGRLRSWLHHHLYGEEICDAFTALKKAFDPSGRLNPGVIVAPPSPETRLRKSPEQIETFLDFSKEGGLALAADLCNGNGLCRKRSGLMCPSFQATGDEFETTRARAQALRAVASGELTLASDALHDVLELCLECKGCKSECPSQVDMAKMKAEALFHRAIPLRSRLFAHTPRTLARLRRRFSRGAPRCFEGDLVLFTDSYLEFAAPQIGHKALALLEHLGHQPILLPYRCCGRPYLSKGMLVHARKLAAALIEQLLPYAKEGVPIVGLEPSCILTIKDDFPSLISSDEAELVASRAVTLDRFLEDRLPPIDEQPLVHIHCHQKALEGGGSAVGEVIDSGCCGMAGSFGYTHKRLSMIIGEERLFPAVRAAEEPIIANGFSCRHQIERGCGKRPLHLAEWLAEILIDP